jgi:uncharacterized protein with gpF-like domain
MYNNEAYYREQLRQAIAEAHDRLSEADLDFLHTAIDAMSHLEGAIANGFKPWEDYGEPVYPFTVTTVDNGAFQVWAEDMADAIAAAREQYPEAAVCSIKRG